MSEGTLDADDITGLIRESAAAHVAGAATLARARRQWIEETGGHDAAAWAELAELGWLGMLAPEAAGGGGLGLAEAAALHEELGRGSIVDPIVMAAHLPILAAAQADGPAATALTAAIAAGEGPCPFVWQGRPGALGLGETALRLRDEAGTLRLDGEASGVVGLDGATTLLVAAREASGIGLWRVAADAAGLRAETAAAADGSPLSRLVFSGVAVGAGDRVASAATGEAAGDAALDAARILLSAEMLGAMREVFARTLDYMRTRKQFGRTIGSFQALQHRAVDLHAQIELTAAALRKAVRGSAELGAVERAVAASGIKARASEAALLVAREAVQMHGAIAYTQEHDIGLFLDRAVVAAALLGNAAAHRRRYGLLVAAALVA